MTTFHHEEARTIDSVRIFSSGGIHRTRCYVISIDTLVKEEGVSRINDLCLIYFLPQIIPPSLLFI